MYSTLRQIRSLPEQSDLSLSDLVQISEFALFFHNVSILTCILLAVVNQARVNNEVLSKRVRTFTAAALERMVRSQR